MRFWASLGVFFLLLFLACAQEEETVRPEVERESFLERVGDFTIAQLHADQFNDLPLEEKILAYYLSQAAIAGRDMNYDQRHRYGIELRHLMEQIITHAQGIPEPLAGKLRTYTKLIWINNGMYNARSARKFTPAFSRRELQQAAHDAQENGATFWLKPEETLEGKLKRLEKTIFDRNYEPMLTNKNPPGGQDRLEASANNLYRGITEADLTRFQERYPLNSHLTKENGQIVEQVYRAGNSVVSGLYAPYLKKIIEFLSKAVPHATLPQQEALRTLIEYFETGDPALWNAYNIAWVRYNPNIEFTLGFIEVYLDARGQKGEYEGMVAYRDRKNAALMEGLSQNAQYFEDRMPWADAYKQENRGTPVANAFGVLMGVGNAGPISWSGINLPNEQFIRERYGSKNFLLLNVITDRQQAEGRGEEDFATTPEEIERMRRSGEIATNVIVALHEVVGHGSGKKDPNLIKDPSDYLKEYYSTLEEARADLVALWHIWDSKLGEIGAFAGEEVPKAAYDDYVRGDLIQMRHVPLGNRFEEDHRRGQHLIVSFIRAHTEAIQTVDRNGRISFQVVDYEAMREVIGELLKEIMRIKAEGDYEAIRELVTRYGTRFNPRWRDQVVRRARAAGFTSNTAFVFPRLTLVEDEEGGVVDVALGYPRDFMAQMLRFSALSEEWFAPPAYLESGSSQVGGGVE